VKAYLVDARYLYGQNKFAESLQKYKDAFEEDPNIKDDIEDDFKLVQRDGISMYKLEISLFEEGLKDDPTSKKIIDDLKTSEDELEDIENLELK